MTRLSRKQALIGLLALLLVLTAFGYWLLTPHIPPLRPMRIVEGVFGDLTRQGFIMFTADYSKAPHHMLTLYNWDGIEQWHVSLPQCDPISPKGPFSTETWVTPDFSRCHNVNRFDHGGEREGGYKQLIRFSPDGTYFGIVTYYKDHVIVSVYRPNQLLWRRTLTRTDIGLHETQEAVDLLVDDSGQVVLYSPCVDQTIDSEHPLFRYIPLAVVTRDGNDTRHVARAYMQLVNAYVNTVRPHDGLPEHLTWKMPIDEAATSAFARYAFIFKELSISQSPWNPFDRSDGKSSLAVYQYPGKCIAQLMVNGKGPMEAHRSMIPFKHGGNVGYYIDVCRAYFSPDNHHLLLIWYADGAGTVQFR